VVLIANRLERGPLDQSAAAELLCFQRFSAWRTIDLKARRAGVNQGLDLD